MSGERYYIRTPTGDIELNGKYRPSGNLRAARPTPQLYRARNQTRVVYLGDGLPDAGPVLLVGEEEAATEDALSELLDELEAELLTATAYSRDGREWFDVQSVTLDAAPFSEAPLKAQKCDTVITIIPVHVRTRGASGFFF